MISFVDPFSIRPNEGLAYDATVISIEELKLRLAKLGRKRPWLVKQTRYSENSIRQYLGPKGKPSEKFIREVMRVIEQEEARQKIGKHDAPPWNLIFLTHEEFLRADQASRLVNAESLDEFCRTTILKRADEILKQRSRSVYPKLVPPSAKVADKSTKPE